MKRQLVFEYNSEDYGDDLIILFGYGTIIAQTIDERGYPWVGLLISGVGEKTINDFKEWDKKQCGIENETFPITKKEIEDFWYSVTRPYMERIEEYKNLVICLEERIKALRRFVIVSNTDYPNKGED